MTQQVESQYQRIDSDFLNDLLLPEKLDSILQHVIQSKVTGEELNQAIDKICHALFLSLDDIHSNSGFIAKLMDVQWSLLDNLSPDIDVSPSISILFDHMFKLINDQGYTPFLKKIFININKFMKKWSQNDCVIKAIQTNKEYFEKLGSYLMEMGDYETQASILETMLRLYFKENSKSLVNKWFPKHPELQESICNFVAGRFELECRDFLNKVNGEVGKVKSLIAQKIQVGSYMVKGPPDCPLWVDLNKDSSEISFYCTDSVLKQSENENWEIICILKETIEDAFVKVGPVPEFQLILNLNIECSQLFIGWPENFEYVTGKSIVIYFDEKLSIESCFKDFFGERYRGIINKLTQSEDDLNLETATSATDIPTSSIFDLIQDRSSKCRLFKNNKDKSAKSSKPIKTDAVSKLKRFSRKIPKISLQAVKTAMVLEKDQKCKILKSKRLKIAKDVKKEDQEMLLSQSLHDVLENTPELNRNGKRSRKAAIISSYKTQYIYGSRKNKRRDNIDERNVDQVGSLNSKESLEEERVKETKEQISSLRRKRSSSSEQSTDGSWIETRGDKIYSHNYKKVPRRNNGFVSLSESENPLEKTFTPSERNDIARINRPSQIPKPPRKSRTPMTQSSDFTVIPADIEYQKEKSVDSETLERPLPQEDRKTINEKDKEIKKDMTNFQNIEMREMGNFKEENDVKELTMPSLEISQNAVNVIDLNSNPSPIAKYPLDLVESVEKDKMNTTVNQETKPKRTLFKNIHSEPHLCKAESHLFQVSSNMEQAVSDMSSRYIETMGETCLDFLRNLATDYHQQLTTIIQDIQPSFAQQCTDDILDYLRHSKSHRILISAKLEHLESIVEKYRKESHKIKAILEQVQIKAAEEFMENLEGILKNTIQGLESDALLNLKSNLSSSMNA